MFRCKNKANFSTLLNLQSRKSTKRLFEGFKRLFEIFKQTPLDNQ
jgi:hypothetical protein